MNKFWGILLIIILIIIEIQYFSLLNKEEEYKEVIVEVSQTELIDSLKDCLVFIENSGNGVVITSDGLVLTLNSIINNNSQFIIKDQSLIYEVLKRDKASDLALVQLGKQGLDTNCKYSLDDVKQGDEVYVLGINGKGEYIFNKGIVKNISELIHTNISEDDSLSGAIAFNHVGEIIGIVKINNGSIDIIPSIILKEFTGL
jgi:hypothetical protein